MSCYDLLRVSQMFRVVGLFPCVIYRRGLRGPYPIKPDVQGAHFPATTGFSPQQRVFPRNNGFFPRNNGSATSPQQWVLTRNNGFFPATTGDEKMPRAAGH